VLSSNWNETSVALSSFSWAMPTKVTSREPMILSQGEWRSLKWSDPIPHRNTKLVQVWTPLQNRETQHVNIVLQCMYQIFEQPNMKGNHAWIESYAFNKCYHILNWFFSFQNLVFWNLFEFWNQCFPHSESKSYQINSIKSCSSRSFQQHQKAHSNSSEIFSYDLIWFNFQWRNHSIFKTVCTSSPNIIMEPNLCTPPHQELSKDTKNKIWSIPVRWDILIEISAK
jgi:hypothetical protein